MPLTRWFQEKCFVVGFTVVSDDDYGDEEDDNDNDDSFSSME